MASKPWGYSAAHRLRTKPMTNEEKNFWGFSNDLVSPLQNIPRNHPNNVPKPINNATRKQLRNAIKNTKYNILGRGAYGSIIKPALPNLVRNDVTLYPENVTKLFYNAPNTSKLEQFVSILKADKQANFSPEMIHRYSVYKYHYPYRSNNIYSSSFLQQSYPKIPDNIELHPFLLRMPYLGYSFIDIVSNKFGNKQQVSKWTQEHFPIICEQIMECLKVLRSIKHAGYIHGDIRETNVMIHPNAGEMTIIDYDWFYPFDDLKERYPYYMYHLPPECMFVFNSKIKHLPHPWHAFRGGRNNGMNPDDLFNNLEFYKQRGVNYLYDSKDLAVALLAFMNMPKNKPLFLNRQFDELAKKIFDFVKDQIDSYGFAFTLRCLFDKCGEYDGIWSNNMLQYNDPTFMTIRDFILFDLIPNMMHSDAFVRWDVDRAIQELNARIKFYRIGKNNGGKRGNRKTVKHSKNKK